MRIVEGYGFLLLQDAFEQNSYTVFLRSFWFSFLMVLGNRHNVILIPFPKTI